MATTILIFALAGGLVAFIHAWAWRRPHLLGHTLNGVAFGAAAPFLLVGGLIVLAVGIALTILLVAALVGP